MNRASLVDDTTSRYENAYRTRTRASETLTRAASKVLPGGETRAGTWFAPYPLWFDGADGCRIWDVDGNEYVDFHNNYSSMVLGHSNPSVVEAVRKYAARGTSLGGLTRDVIRLAELICARVGSVAKVRFATSGTEAVMAAVRVARAFTGRDLIVKTEGCFHGSYDPVIYPSNAPGLPQSVIKDSVAVPYNDVAAAEKAITKHQGTLAAVIIEAALGTNGMIPPQPGYLEAVRTLTSEAGVLLILDEIITLRLAPGGIQGMQGIKPDLTIMGKMIGGGYPIGAIGGREDIMQLFSPEIRRVHQSGTFVAHPITAVAGAATLAHFGADEIARINALGERLAAGLRGIFAKLRIKAHVTGIGSLQNVHFRPSEPVDAGAAGQTDKRLLHLFHLAMVEREIFPASRGLFAVSTPMSDREIDAALAAAESALVELRPIVKDVWPELVD